MTTTGGVGVWSDAIATLAERLETAYADRAPVALDWGMARNVAFLTGTRVAPREAFEYRSPPSPQFARIADELVADARHLFVFHAPELTVFRGHREALDEAATRGGKRLRLLETIAQRDGMPNLLLYGADGDDQASTVR